MSFDIILFIVVSLIGLYVLGKVFIPIIKHLAKGMIISIIISLILYFVFGVPEKILFVGSILAAFIFMALSKSFED